MTLCTFQKIQSYRAKLRLSILLLTIFGVGPQTTVAQQPGPPVTYRLSYLDSDGYLTSRNTTSYAQGLAVGISTEGAVLVTADGAKFPLVSTLSPADQLVWQLESAIAINEFNQIAGRGLFYNGSGWVSVCYRLSLSDVTDSVIEPIFPTAGEVTAVVGGINNWGTVCCVTTGGLPGADVIVFEGPIGAGQQRVALKGEFAANSQINDMGQLTGGLTVSSVMKAYRYTPEAPLQTFEALADWKKQSFKSQGFAINSYGEWVGHAAAVKTKTGSNNHAVRCSGTALINLGLLPGTSTSRAQSINDAGVIVGFCDGRHGFVYFASGASTGNMYSMQAVLGGNLPAGVSALVPRHINNDGVICGEVQFSNSSIRGGFVLLPN